MKRENNYDLLRIISTIVVIMIHVSTAWLSNNVEIVAGHDFRIKGIQDLFLICIYSSIPRFAVPCFVMLSGAFIIDNKKNAYYKRFYSKMFVRICVPTSVFSALYICYRLLACFVGVDRDIRPLLKDIIIGSPMYHMWYLYMLIGIYALVPIVIHFKESVSEKNFYVVSFVFLILASISWWTMGAAKLNWDIGQSFEYLGYFMAGYCIRKIFSEKDNHKALILIGTGILLEICVAGLEYRQIISGALYHDLKYRLLYPYCPIIVSAAICIFIGFTLLDVEKERANLSALTFYIYLIHAGVWDVIQKVFKIVGGGGNCTKRCGVDSYICCYSVCGFIPVKQIVFMDLG